MDTFLSTLLTMSVTAALVAGIVMLLRLVLRPLPRWITCALWGVVFLRMICPVGLSLPVSLVPQAITSGAYVQHLLPAEPGPAQETVPVQDTPAPAEHTLSAGDGTPPAPAAPADIPRPALLTGVWAAGAGAALLWAAVSYARLRWQVAEAVPVEKGSMRATASPPPSSAACSALGSISPPPSQRKTVTMSCSMSGPICTGGTTGPSPWPYLALCLHWFNPPSVAGLPPVLPGRGGRLGDQAVIRPLGREDTARYARHPSAPGVPVRLPRRCSPGLWHGGHQGTHPGCALLPQARSLAHSGHCGGLPCGRSFPVGGHQRPTGGQAVDRGDGFLLWGDSPPPRALAGGAAGSLQPI